MKLRESYADRKRDREISALEGKLHRLRKEKDKLDSTTRMTERRRRDLLKEKESATEQVRNGRITVGELANLIPGSRDIYIKPGGQRTYFEGSVRNIPESLKRAKVNEIQPRLNDEGEPILGIWVDSNEVWDTIIDAFPRLARNAKDWDDEYYSFLANPRWYEDFLKRMASDNGEFILERDAESLSLLKVSDKAQAVLERIKEEKGILEESLLRAVKMLKELEDAAEPTFKQAESISEPSIEDPITIESVAIDTLRRLTQNTDNLEPIPDEDLQELEKFAEDLLVDDGEE